MSQFAYRHRETTVTLRKGETQVFRMPPTTRGTILVKARVIHPIGGGGVIPARRDHRGGPTPEVPPVLDATRGGVVRDRRDGRDHRGGVGVPPTVRDGRVVSRDPRGGDADGGGGRDRVVDHRDSTARTSRRPRIWDHVRDGILVVDGLLDDGHDPVPGSGTPTDLKMDLLLGGSIVKQTHGHKLMLQSEYVGDVWQLRLTRENEGGPDEQRYIIEAYYPSILPVLSREITIAAFQSAFDSNWNQHPYVTMEMRDSHFYITFDEDFRQLYGLENYEKDLSWISALAIGSLPNFTGAIRFSMHIKDHPITVNGVRKAPVMVVDASTSIGVGVSLEFFLGYNYMHHGGAGFVGKAEVRGIDDDVPRVDVRAEVEKAVQGFIDGVVQKNQRAFGEKFTPWLIGEPHRELLDIVIVDAVRGRFRVDWVGARPPPSTEPVVTDEIGPSEPRPEPPPYLFQHPDETPPQGPTEGREPHHPYITSAGPLEVIENIVVLMMENRSFDQVLGYLSRDEGRTDVDGLSADDLQHWEEFPDNHPRRPHRLETTAWPGFRYPGPSHHSHEVEAQMGPQMRMDKFVANFDRRAKETDKREELLERIKGYFGPDQLKAYKVLTDEFAICDRWFTAHAGPTWPNRFLTFTGDLNLDHSGQVEKDNPDIATMTPAQAKTIFDHLTERGHSWRVYEHGYSFLRLYGRYTFETQRIVDFRDRARGFIADAQAGRLPKLAFIEPDYVDLPPGNDDHPPADMADGQLLVATVVKALLESPQWQKTMLIITYDEHGGFYDHVPPEDGPPLAGNNPRRGPRVPAFVVSPWVKKADVSSLTYDHTTILSTILRTFCSPHPPRLSPRADAARDLRALIQATPRPRSDFDDAHRRLSELLAVPRNPPRPAPPRLVARPEGDDFHAVMRYVRSFT